MLKNNIRSIRFSDEMMEIINQQVGDNFNQKFERLVYNCYMLKDQRQAEIAQLDKEIAEKRKKLSDLSHIFWVTECSLRELGDKIHPMYKIVKTMEGVVEIG